MCPHSFANLNIFVSLLLRLRFVRCVVKIYGILNCELITTEFVWLLIFDIKSRIEFLTMNKKRLKIGQPKRSPCIGLEIKNDFYLYFFSSKIWPGRLTVILDALTDLDTTCIIADSLAFRIKWKSLNFSLKIFLGSKTFSIRNKK